MMDLWVLKAMNDKILLTGEVLRQKWNTFATLVGIPEDDRLKLSEGWLTRFKERNGLKEVWRSCIIKCRDGAEGKETDPRTHQEVWI